MMIFIPSKGRATTIKTHLLLDGYANYAIVVHNVEEAEAYKKNPTINPNKVIISYQPYSITKQRQWIKKHLVKKDDWFCMMDDNIKYFNKFPDDVYTTEKLEPYDPTRRYELTNHKCDYQTLEKCFEESIKKAEEIGTGFIGFANTDNPFFRKTKWITASLICAKMCLIKNDELEYDNNIHCIDDYAYSISAMVKYGKILLNNFVHPAANHNEPGGLGRLSERVENKRKDCEYLIKKYPELLTYRSRVNSAEGCELRLRPNSINFHKWHARFVGGECKEEVIKPKEIKVDYHENKIRDVIREAIVKDRVATQKLWQEIKASNNPYAAVESGETLAKNLNDIVESAAIEIETRGLACLKA